MSYTEFIVISITLIILVVITFKIKVPMASLPLGFIYLIFILIQYKESLNTETDTKPNISENKIEETILKNEKKQVDLIKKPKVEEPLEKQITFLPKQKTIKNNMVIQNTIVPKKVVENKREKVKPQKKKSKENSKNPDNLGKQLVLKDIKICKLIQNRKPIDIGVEFANSVDSLYCYTRIQNLGQKKEVRHIWYFENQIMTQVRYNVKKSNIYRSWTKKTILPYHVGNWRVDVQDQNGTIIGSKKFRITTSTNSN